MKKKVFLSQLGDYFETYLPSIRNASTNTISSYGYAFSLLFEYFYEEKNLSHANITYKQLTPALFDDFILWMNTSRNYSASSVRQRMTAITSFLKYASAREMSALKAYSAAMDSELPKAPQEEVSYFTADEMRIILSLPNPKKYLGDRDLVFLSVLYDSGARAQEMCNLRVGSIRFGKPTKLKLSGKGKKDREIPLSEDVANLLRYHLKQNNFSLSDKEKWLFLNQDGNKMTTACVRSIVKKYVNMAKKQHPDLFNARSYSPHSFRHSKAVHMVEAGIDLIHIRNFLGHEHVTTTEIYARIGQDAVTKALTDRKLPQVAGKATVHNQSQCQLPDFIIKARNIM